MSNGMQNGLPRGWTKTQLQHLLREPLRNGHSARATSDGSGVRTLTLTAVTVGDFSEKHTKMTSADPERVKDLWLQAGDLLIQRSNTKELVGTARIFRGPPGFAIFPDLLIRGRLSQEVLDRYIEYYLQSMAARAYFQRSAQGIAGSMPKIDQGTIERLEVPLAPRLEQDRIVSLIEKNLTDLDAGVVALKRVQANLKRYRASVLNAACEGRLVPTEAEFAQAEGRDYEPADKLIERILKERQARWTKGQPAKSHEKPSSIDAHVLPSLPTGWCWTTVQQLSSDEPNAITDGPFGSNLKTEHYTAEGPRVVRLQNIGNGIFIDEKAHISLAHFERLAKHRVYPGDVVVAALGETLPRACIVPESLGPAIVKADCVRVKSDQRLCLSQYLAIALNAESTRRRTAKIIHGVGRPRMNLGEIKAIAIALPPLSEQARICAEVDRHLSLADQAEKMTRSTLERAKKLRQSILKQAFEGSLVSQDPNDEPASGLLERIRQRGAAPSPGSSSPEQMVLGLEKPNSPRAARRRSVSS